MLELYWTIMNWLTRKTLISNRYVYFKFNNGLQHTFHFGFVLTFTHIFGRGLAVRLSLGDSSRFEIYTLKMWRNETTMTVNRLKRDGQARLASYLTVLALILVLVSIAVGVSK